MEVIEYTDEFVPDSTSIKTLWYNQNTMRLTVAFKTGGIYSYDEVTYQLYRDFVNAESAGRFHREMFRNADWNGEKHSDDAVPEYVEPIPMDKVVKASPEFSSSLSLLVARSAGPNAPEFEIEFSYQKREKIKVRAADLDSALNVARAHYKEQGIDIIPIGVFITL